MSNPAVITLESRNNKDAKFKRFALEDNIGEAIHLHIDEIRIDFSIAEFLEFSKMIRLSIKKLNIIKGYNIDNFDEHFLLSCASLLPNLIEVKKEKVKLKDLKAISFYKYKGLILKKIIKLNETPAYKYLKGRKDEFINYPQFNYFKVNNEQRLLNLKESVKNNGYPYNEKYIVLFNGQDLIRDGQHRAVILAYLYGLDHEIEILRFYFKGEKHLIFVSKENITIQLKWIILKLYKKILGTYKKIKV